jgi:hypothetical protein
MTAIIDFALWVTRISSMLQKQLLSIGLIIAAIVGGCVKTQLPAKEPEILTSSEILALGWILNGNYTTVMKFRDMPDDIRNSIPVGLKEAFDTNAPPLSTAAPVFTLGGYSENRAFIVDEAGDIIRFQYLTIKSRTEPNKILFRGYCTESVRSLEELKHAIKKEIDRASNHITLQN